MRIFLISFFILTSSLHAYPLKNTPEGPTVSPQPKEPKIKTPPRCHVSRALAGTTIAFLLVFGKAIYFNNPWFERHRNWLLLYDSILLSASLVAVYWGYF